MRKIPSRGPDRQEEPLPLTQREAEAILEGLPTLREDAAARAELRSQLPPTDAPGLQLGFPIDYAPEDVRSHGLQEAHSHPLVSRGKLLPDDRYDPVRRVPAMDAWTWPELEMYTPSSFPVVVFDLDGPGSMARYAGAERAGLVAPASWVAERPESGGVHVVYTLKRPTLRGAAARRSPLYRRARIEEFYTAALKADTGYHGLLTHNPTHPRFVTRWGHTGGHTYAGLEAYIESNWRMPPAAARVTLAGRNCALFETGITFASQNRDDPAVDFEAILDLLVARNVGVGEAFAKPPLDWLEVRGIARSVSRYLDEWRAGRHHPRFLANQRRKGHLSGERRREATAERDAAILAAREAGLSLRAIAGIHGISRNAVHHVVNRGVP